jgi:YVTN family beta-propeller protein
VGEPGPPEGPTDGAQTAVFRAFLITDIRGYSSFAAQRGDEATAALARRFAEGARRVIEPGGGQIIGLAGDEVLAAFESPRLAIRAALALQQWLVEATRGDPSLPMPAGVGLDFGEAVIAEDGYRANAINVAARLCSAAGAGEILATEELSHVAQALDGVSYQQRPPLVAKGIERPVRHVRIVGADGDQAKQFREMGVLHAAPPPVRRRAVPRRAIAAGIAMVVVGTGVGVGLTVTHGGASSITPDTLGAVDISSSSVGEVVSLQTEPTQVATDRTGDLWVTSTSAGTVTRVDPANSSTSTIKVGNDPDGICVAPDGSVWVAESGSGTVSRISPRTNTVVGTIRTRAGASAVAADSSGVWVANTLDGSVSKIDTSTDRVVRTVPVGSEPEGIAIGGDSVWVSLGGDDSVVRLDPGTGRLLAQPIAVGNEPQGIAFGDGAAWVANGQDGTVSRIDATSGAVNSITVGSGPASVAVDANHVWVSDEYGDAVSVIDPSRGLVTGSIPTASAPLGLAVSGNKLWVAADGLGAIIHRGGVLTIAASDLTQYGVLGQSIDPATAYTPQLWDILMTLGDGLVGYRRTGGVAGAQLVPDLAASLPAPTDNGLTYRFQLRPGSRFSDGAPVVASDFRYGLQRSLELNVALHGGPAAYFTGLVGASRCTATRCDLSRGVATDDAAGTLTFHLTARDPDFLYQLTLPPAWPIPQSTPLHLPVGGSVPGTGPYRVTSYQPVDRAQHRSSGLLVLERNPYFKVWSAAAQPDGFPDRIVFHSGLTTSGELAAVRAGRADLMWDPVTGSARQQLAATEPQQLHTVTVTGTSYLALNAAYTPFDNLLARKAVDYAIDRGALARMAARYSGFNAPFNGTPTCQLLPPDVPGYVPYCPYTIDPRGDGHWSGPDLSRAKALVRRSGTRHATVTLAPVPGAPTRFLKVLITTLDRIGYRARVQRISNAQFGGLFSGSLKPNDKYQIVLAGWASDYVAPSNFTAQLVACSPKILSYNIGFFCNDSLTAMMLRAFAADAARSPDATAEWTAIDHRITDLAADVPLSNERDAYFVSARTGDFQYSPAWQLLIDQLWVR